MSLINNNIYNFNLSSLSSSGSSYTHYLKPLAFFIFCFIYFIQPLSTVKTQTLFFFNLDKSRYPILSSDYIYLDNTNNYLDITSEKKINILDNTLKLEAISKIGAGQSKFDVNNIVIAFDLSIDTIVNTSLGEAKSKFDITKEIAKQVVLNDNLSKSNYSILPFDYKNYPILIGSKNKAEISQVIDDLGSYRFSSIDTLFSSLPYSLNNFFSLEKINEISHNKKVKNTVLLFTDKNISADSLTLSIYTNILKQNNINIVLCFLGNDLSNEFKTLCSVSNESESGYYISDLNKLRLNSNNSIDSVLYYSKVLNGFVNGVKPSHFLWYAKYNCDKYHMVEMSIDGTSTSANFGYELEDNLKSRLIIDKPYINFSNIVPKSTAEEEITFTADNTDITISKFEIENDYDNTFSIIEGQINESKPLVVTKGDSHKVKIRFSPIDSTIVFIKLVARSTACAGQEVWITGGFPNTPPKRKNVQIVNPECKDLVFANDTFSVRWAGVLPKDIIQLDYSLNNGQKWDTLATNLTDLSYIWNVPDVESNQALVKIVQLWPNNIGKTVTLKHNDALNIARFSYMSDKIVTASKNGEVLLWSAKTGGFIRSLIDSTSVVKTKAFTKSANYAEFSYDGRLVAAGSDDGYCKVWNIADGTILYKFQNNSKVLDIALGKNNGLLALSTDTGYVRIYNLRAKKGQELIYEFLPDSSQKSSLSKINHLEFTNKSGNTLITAGSKGIVKFWDISNLLNPNVSDKTPILTKAIDIKDKQGNGGKVISFAINTNDDRLAVVDQLTKNCSIWDLNQNKMLYKVNHNTYSQDEKDTSKTKVDPVIINSVSFFNSGQIPLLVTSGVNNRAVVWNAITGDSLKALFEHTNSVQSTFYNFDGSMVVTSSWDSTAKIWNLNQKDLQADTSNCVFRIVKPQMKVNAITAPTTLVTESKEFYVSDFISNLSDFPYLIKKVDISGPNKGEFVINEISGKSPKQKKIIDSMAILDAKIVFKPLSVGERNAVIDVYTPGRKFSIPISGTAIEKELIQPSLYYDFATVEVGDFKNKKVVDFLENSVSKTITINNISLYKVNSEHFKILDKGKSSLSSKEKTDINIRFNPRSSGRIFSVLEVTSEANNSPIKILLGGQGVTPYIDSLRLKLSPVQANVSDVVNLRLEIEKISQGELKTNVSGIQTRIKFNSTILNPLEKYPYDEISNNVREIGFTIPLNTNQIKEKLDLNEGVVVVEIPFKVTLGNDTLSKVEIFASTPLENASVAIFEESTTFNILNFCREGGVRTIETGGRLEIKQNYPNPANDLTSIDFSVIEQGKYYMFLQDVSGNVVFELLNQELVNGDYTIKFDTQNIPSGLYNIVLQTPSQFISRTMTVVR